jgi:hypothetical protein
MTQMNPGMGYWVYNSGAEFELAYPEGIDGIDGGLQVKERTSGYIPDELNPTRNAMIFVDKSAKSTLNGNPIPVNSIITVFDADGVMCGWHKTETANQIGCILVYGDDLTTDADEGAVKGDILTFKINGVTAECISGTPVFTHFADIQEIVLQVGSTTDLQENGNLVSEYRVSANYPNPFNPETCIDFSLPAAASVNFIVYNVLGHVMTNSNLGNYNPGSYSVNWNPAAKGINLSSGIYFYQFSFETGNGLIVSEMKKMMLIK